MDTENITKQEPKVFVKRITFNDNNSFEFNHSDIVVFTGANNAGKSQVLKDIFQFLQAKEKKLCKIITNLEGDFIGDIDTFLDSTKINRDGSYWTGGSYQHKSNIKLWWSNKTLVHGLHSNFVNILNTEQRLTSSNSPTAFDSIEEIPQHPIHHLYIDDEKEKKVSEYFKQAFGIDLIVDRGAGSKIPLFVGNNPIINSGEDRVSISYRQRLIKLPRLQEQGDGMRSFAGILLDTFTSTYNITLIDEPEAFLHPPQARLLGKMLAENNFDNRQLFIATHSEDFLKGLLNADNKNVKIIRIDRNKDVNNMNILNNKDIKRLWNDPLLRYSNILSGLFHTKVIICESDTDCRFYQAIMDSLPDEDYKVSLDILFTHCGGKQRLKTVIIALKALDVKVSTIADIDVLNDETVFKDITNTLKIDWEKIESNWKVINNYVKEQRAQLDTNKVKEEITKILDSVSESSFPINAVEKIKIALKGPNAWPKIKEVGKSCFRGDAYKAYQEIDAICRTNGLFIVPVGELECFYKLNTNHGTKWVNEILEKVDLKQDTELEEARKFVREIIG
jgi:predicted ATP-dependent endonuclease of OLD family